MASNRNCGTAMTSLHAFCQGPGEVPWMKVTKRHLTAAQRAGGYGTTFDKGKKTAVSTLAPDFFLIPQVKHHGCRMNCRERRWLLTPRACGLSVGAGACDA